MRHKNGAFLAVVLLVSSILLWGSPVGAQGRAGINRSQGELPPPAPGDYSEGDVISFGDLSIEAPEPGVAIEAHGDLFDGSSQMLTVHTLEDGSVEVTYATTEPTVGPIHGSLASSTPRTPRRDPSQCSDNYTASAGGVWLVNTIDWWFMASTTPGYLNVNDVEDDIRAGGTNNTQENNTCGRSDTVVRGLHYEGRNSVHANIRVIDNQTRCFPSASPHDGINEVDFFDLSSGFIAVTCNYDPGEGTLRYESDIRLNRADFEWATGGATCDRPGEQFYVEGITTHERGHTFEASDFPNGHSELTMGGANGQCSGGGDEKQTLGLGDMKSIEVNN
jgi:hypothetical protein